MSENKTIFNRGHFLSLSILFCALIIFGAGMNANASEGFGAALDSLNSQNFPFIFLNVRVADNGTAVTDLTADNFQCSENGTAQADFFQVTPPQTSGGVRLADIIFLIDTSGSMGNAINEVKNNVNAFADVLAVSDIDYRLGLAQFGQSLNNGHPELFNDGNLTNDADQFKGFVSTLGATGGHEPGFLALRMAAQGFNFRPGAQKVFLLISDEDSDGRNKESTIALMQANDIAVHTAVDCSYGSSNSDYCDDTSVRAATGGQLFGVQGPYSEILNSIVEQTASAYIIRYKSSNPSFDGTERVVECVITRDADQTTISGSYIPGSAPSIALSPQTETLNQNTLLENSPDAIIRVSVTDEAAPFIQSNGVRLYYKTNNSGSGYSSMIMNLNSQYYEATIPVVSPPGIDYYITATDGEQTSSLPSTDPGIYSFQIAVSPNVAPKIDHEPVTSASKNQPITITAAITDTTEFLAETTLKYRRTGELIYKAIEMQNTSGAIFEAVIPADDVTEDIEYYLIAKDNFNVAAFKATADKPFVIKVEEESNPKKYAPNLWFDSDENYYPIDPFFYTNDINGITGEDSKTNYLNLSDEEKKKNKFTVFYHIAETKDKKQWVYEYFFYYAYNDFWNEHHHDWEGVFVFVDKKTKEVKRVVASAHGKWANNNEYFHPNFNSGESAGIMIEEGSHANCIDRNNDGLFQGNDITNGPFPFAWEIGKLPPWTRTINDKEYGYQIQPKTYLPNLIEITDNFIKKFKNYKSFPNSPTLGIGCFNVPIFGGRKCVSGVGGKPPEHPWHNEAYNEPDKIIPKLNNFINGTINPFGSLEMQGIVLVMSEEPYPFTFTDENGEFLINNIEPGEHNLIINLENYVPYKQRFIIEENETIVGVNGILNLIPESESFRIEGIAKDEKGNLIVNAIVDVYDENGNKLFTTLTNENGQYLFNLSSKNNHTIKIINEDKIGEIENISANPGETIIEETIVSNPKSLKENTLSELKEVKTENKTVKNQINKIEKLIEESLDESFWIDNWHLEERKGRKVFQKEYSAVRRIENVLKYSKSKSKKNKCQNLESILPILDKVADDLSQADYLLAETILNETKKEIEELDKNNLNKKQKRLLKRIQKRIERAEQCLKQAEKQKLKKNYSRSVLYSMRTWNSVVFTKKFLRKF